ncbi:P1 family peptidase [Albidovulum sp.]|uniref:P1 family peptidase n=1 Tax=Albidovulum sp. TaxID=1872424 RepID=UPI0039B8C800
MGGQSWTVGVLVQANHGLRPWLSILGRAVGQLMPEGCFSEQEAGPIIVILATDAPLSGLALRQMAKRVALGIGRGGTSGGNNSGDIFLAPSIADPGPMPGAATALITRQEINIDRTDPLYPAAVEAVEEAVANAIVAGEEAVTVKPRGKVCHAIDARRLTEIFTGEAG